jgi:hypothetical protein
METVNSMWLRQTSHITGTVRGKIVNVEEEEKIPEKWKTITRVNCGFCIPLCLTQMEILMTTPTYLFNIRYVLFSNLDYCVIFGWHNT